MTIVRFDIDFEKSWANDKTYSSLSLIITLQRERVVMASSHLFTYSCLAERGKLIRGRAGRRLRVSHYYFSDYQIYS